AEEALFFFLTNSLLIFGLVLGLAHETASRLPSRLARVPVAADRQPPPGDRCAAVDARSVMGCAWRPPGDKSPGYKVTPHQWGLYSKRWSNVNSTTEMVGSRIDPASLCGWGMKCPRGRW